MLEHRRCRCTHLRVLHGGPNDSECRVCARKGTACYRFRWRRLPWNRTKTVP